MSVEERKKVVPRVIFFGGKAAPGYYIAKLIIQLINNVATVINADKTIGDLLKVIFIPNYCVSLCEIIVPASELSQHISTAGMEASGTSNMKFAMNGCLIIGTMDGANVEICREIGEENIFIFGARAHEIEGLRKQVREKAIPVDPRFDAVLDLIEKGTFGANVFTPILNSLRNGNDYYLLAVDFPSYIKAQEEVDATYKTPTVWVKKSIMSTAGCGKFSSDRTIKQYAQKIWNIKPVRRPGPVSVSVERLGTLGINTEDIISPGTSPSNVISLERMTPTLSPKIVQRDFIVRNNN
jgi:starch phosphorylase